MRLSEYEALVEKIGAEIVEVSHKYRDLNPVTDHQADANGIRWAIHEAMVKAWASDCKFFYAATLDAIDDFTADVFDRAYACLDFEPEGVTGHRSEMLIIDELSDWPADTEYKWHEMGRTIKWATLSEGSDKEVPKFYGKSLYSLIEEIESANDPGQLLKSTIHPPITADMAASGPWPQLGITQIDSPSPATPYIPTYQAEPKEEEKPSEDEGLGGVAKPQSAAEDFSAIAKRMKELAAEKGNS